MNISEPFIRRPVATTLLTLGVTLAGALAFKLLPVAPLPQVDIPTISVSASLPGASPEVMAATVATPLERAMGRIAGITEITSNSSLGSTNIVMQFELNRSIDGAARDVQAAIQAARTELPTSLPNNPTYRKVNPADAPAMIFALTSDAYSPGQVYDIANTIVAQKIAQVSGVGQVSVGGSSSPAVRVELNPTTLNKYGIGFNEVRAAIQANNVNRPKGIVEDGEKSWQIYANDQAKKAADYLPIIVAYRNNAPVRLGDVAEVVDSVQDLRNAGFANGKPSVVVVVTAQPNANIIETVDRVLALVPTLQASIPASIDMNLVMERTTTIRASLREAERTMLIAVALVIMVVFLFLRNWRAALIPAVAVPVSLIGTFSFMYLVGYSLDNLSLMALTIATGFVVDDAIVVLENVSRHLEKGVPPFEAALRGAREVSFTVVSMSLSLIAVFIPILLMGGIIGRYFREFAVTLSIAILVSLVVSLTTTPMMCARLLRNPPAPNVARPPGRFTRWGTNLVTAAGARIHLGYEKSLRWALRFPFLVFLTLVAAVGLNIYLYVALPKGFLPQQDTGRIFGNIQADQSISFQAMRSKVVEFVDIVLTDPDVVNVAAFTGGGQRNSGRMFMSLKPLKERSASAEQIAARLRLKLAKVAGANLFLVPAQDFRAGGRSSNASYQFTLQGDDVNELRKWAPLLQNALMDATEMTDVNTDQQVKGLQMSLVIDRATASRMGVTTANIDSALYLAFGQAQVSTIYSASNQYRVVMEAAPQYWQSPEALNGIYVLSSTRGQVPLSAFARYEPTTAALSINHQGQFAATTLSFNLTDGVALSTAIQKIRDTMARIGVPNTITGTNQGTAKIFQQGLENQPWLILAALLTVYVVLGMLYESYIHPLTIISTLPSAGVGALLALWATGTELSIIALIGIILLIGIVKKNAILMIDFAIDAERKRGLSARDAIFEACMLRFRPIMMTTMAALLGAVPLAIGFGDGAELRKPLGISILGGLILSQLLTLYTTPVVYLYLDRFSFWCQRKFRRKGAGQTDAITLEA
ncbi:MAG: multidrug efflux RND transporter permease subunit [Betaproteobacteria bacterium]|nr:multidrug efflux RND transporter permease subunit [Betaproteobacteria bacterium]